MALQAVNYLNCHDAMGRGLNRRFDVSGLTIPFFPLGHRLLCRSKWFIRPIATVHGMHPPHQHLGDLLILRQLLLLLL